MTGHSGERRSAAGWVTLGLSVLVVAILVGIAIREELERKDAGTVIAVTFDRGAAMHRGDEYLVPFTVYNTGADAISSGDILIEVYDGERLVESTEVTVEFLPREGRQDGVYVSAFDPTTHEVRAQLESLQFP
jgi:uncharacterized protein (TIGR02588 family)